MPINVGQNTFRTFLIPQRGCVKLESKLYADNIVLPHDVAGVSLYLSGLGGLLT